MIVQATREREKIAGALSVRAQRASQRSNAETLFLDRKTPRRRYRSQYAAASGNV